MKKIINIILLSLLIILISCREEEIVYQDGDRITYNGVIYEYDIITFTEDRVLDAPTYDYKNPEQAIYHQAYYLDMLHPENYVDISDVYLYGWTKPSKSSTFYEFIKASDKFDTDYYGYYESFISKIGFLDEDLLENIDGKINSGIEGTIYNPLYLWHRGLYQYADETYSLGTQLALKYGIYPGLWWVVGIEEGATDVRIPKEINGIEVAGIGYNAIENINIDTFIVEETDSDIPFIIMPLGINNSKIFTIDINRKTVLSSYALSNIGDTYFYFKDLAVVGAGFYNINAKDLEIEHLLIEENFPSPKEGESILAISGYIDPLFKDCEISKVKCPQIITGEYNVYYLYNNYGLGIQSIRLCSNGTKPKTLYLGEGYLGLFYIKDSQIKSFIAEQELYSDLENIIIIRSSYMIPFYYIPDGKYFVKDNVLYLRQMCYSKNHDSYEDAELKICDVSANVNVLTINTNLI